MATATKTVTVHLELTELEASKLRALLGECAGGGLGEVYRALGPLDLPEGSKYIDMQGSTLFVL